MTNRQPPQDRSSSPSEIQGGGVVLTLTPDQLYVTFAEIAAQELDAFFTQYRLRPIPEEYGNALRSDPNEIVLGQRWLQSAAGENTARLITEIRADNRVTTATPVYHRADLLPVVTGLSFIDRLLVRFHPRATEEEIRSLVEALGTEDVVVMPDERGGPLHQLRLQDPKRQDMFEIVSGFARSPMVRYAGPDWIQLHSPLAATPNDPRFAEQWNLTQIGAPAGWDITAGSRNIVIAIVDSGCDLNHPDLVANYVPVPDRLDLNSNQPGGGHDPQDDEAHGGHGTLVAGVAAATWNNNIDVAGIAPNCLIMPIRIFGGPQPGLWESNIVRAIDWARTHGAHVVNMSWYYTGPQANTDIALNSAHAAGLVLIAASGNCFPNTGCTRPAPIDYPASHPTAIAVGASDGNARRHHLASLRPDLKPLKDPWESKYGPELSVVAPTTVPTTTNNNTPGLFTGTSASAPHVAGLAALLLSLLQHPVNIPPFTQINDLVRTIIEMTAAKVGGYSYTADAAHPNGSWNVEMGYGRIDVASALGYALNNYTTYKWERVSRDYASAAWILFGLTAGGPGVVLPAGGPPGPVDPGWRHLTPQARDVLLGLAITALAGGVNDPEARRALERAGREAIERAAQQIGHD